MVLVSRYGRTLGCQGGLLDDQSRQEELQPSPEFLTLLIHKAVLGTRNWFMIFFGRRMRSIYWPLLLSKVSWTLWHGTLTQKVFSRLNLPTMFWRIAGRVNSTYTMVKQVLHRPMMNHCNGPVYGDFGANQR
jgi:hypothetical protein